MQFNTYFDHQIFLLKISNMQLCIEEWWAEKKVSWYDPLINDSDPLLTNHHKTHLFKDFLKEWQ